VRARDGRRDGTAVTAHAPGDASGAREASGARSVARKLALQALYRWQLNAGPWQDLVQEFGESADMPRADAGYFRALVEGVWHARCDLDARLARLADRDPQRLDPIEHAALLIGLYELSSRPEVPFRVAINEAVGLARRFGATGGHKYVNAVLDRAARELRPHEH
jgi:transcription antitermination protein NusB